MRTNGHAQRVEATFAYTRQGRVLDLAGVDALALSFHPELTGEDRIHRLLLSSIGQE